MAREALMIVTALGAVGMLVIFAYAVHKYGEASRRQRAAKSVSRKKQDEAEPGVSPRLRAYALLRILPLPLAVPTFAVGLGGSHAAMVAGFVLVGLWLIDTALIMPMVLARESRAKRRQSTA